MLPNRTVMSPQPLTKTVRLLARLVFAIAASIADSDEDCVDGCNCIADGIVACNTLGTTAAGGGGGGGGRVVASEAEVED